MFYRMRLFYDNMNEAFFRTSLLLGEEKLNRFASKNIIIFGVGGVGGYVVEALVRSGLENLTIVDYDNVDITNINRQIIADTSTIGQPKVEVFKKRISLINPECKVKAMQDCFTNENKDSFEIEKYDYVIDCIDMVKSKLDLICLAKEKNIPIISALGAGNKLDPTRLEVSDISKTSVDPLAKVIRVELRKRNIENLKVVYSKEEPIKIYDSRSNTKVIGSTSFVPSSMGLIIASEVIKDLIK